MSINNPLAREPSATASPCNVEYRYYRMKTRRWSTDSTVKCSHVAALCALFNKTQSWRCNCKSLAFVEPLCGTPQSRQRRCKTMTNEAFNATPRAWMASVALPRRRRLKAYDRFQTQKCSAPLDAPQRLTGGGDQQRGCRKREMKMIETPNPLLLVA